MKAVFEKSEKKIKSVVIFPPMIDLAPTDLTCIYSTLKYVEELAKKTRYQYAHLTKHGGRKFCYHQEKTLDVL